jgi:nicotinamidase-related amidase
MAGEEHPAPGGDLRARFDRAAVAFTRIARRIRDRGAWDDAFVDALCEPPQSFTYGGVLSHVLTYGAVRREALASVLRELGAEVPAGDPILWEDARSGRTRIDRNATMS